MSRISDLLEKLQASPCVSGSEQKLESCIPPLPSEIHSDSYGNLWFCKKSKFPGAKKIVLEAHRDEIGLCVAKILDGGFVSVSFCGGIDPDILPSEEFIIYGKKRITAIAASVPPHLKNQDKDASPLTEKDILLDTGFSSKKELETIVSVGDPVHFAAPCLELTNGKILSRGLDNKVGVLALLLTYEILSETEHEIYFLLSTAEETTSNGSRAICRKIRPDLAIVVDAGFSYCEGLDPSKCIQMGKGAAVSFTDTLSRQLTKTIIRIAKKNELPLQIICEPGGTGTSATVLQLQNGGIPCAVISIPILNMHTSSEIVLEKDIWDTANLLCAIVADKHIDSEESFHE